ncbi:MAG: nucleotide exchange factor GrpE [Gammaproteobacteria bacterium]|nr:nucleotide exchange factor GrpE [Gammaproteobacteria bacterium]
MSEEKQKKDENVSAEEVESDENNNPAPDDKEAVEADNIEITQGEASSIEEQLRVDLEIAMKKAEENLELAQRTQAEMDNLRKRTSRDIENAHKFALEKFVNELLPVIDSLVLGIQASESASDSDSLVEGMNLTLKKFTDIMEKFGIEVIDPQGEKFNPDRHNAVSMAESDEYESGNIMSVLQKGYELNGRLIRPAMVVVVK